MNPIRREVLNGLFVIVLSTLLNAAIAAFQLKFNLQFWVLVAMAVAIAVGGYVAFKFLLSTEGREIACCGPQDSVPRSRQRSYCNALR